MQEITFLVQGSAPEPYEVSFVKRSEANLSAYCTCPAGENGKHCKHRSEILTGSVDGIVSDNLEEVQTVCAWMVGTDVEAALMETLQLEKEGDRIKKALAAAKKKLATAMRD